MVVVKYDDRTTDEIVFDEWVHIAVRLVEDSEEGVRRKFVEEIEQCQSRDAYAIFEHIDVLLFVEGKLFVDGFEKRYDVAVVIPHEKVKSSTSYDCHATLPDSERSHRRIIFILESTVERFLVR